MKRIFGFLIGLMVGWLFGSTISLLFAPESGEELRAELRSRANALKGEVESAARHRRQQLEDQLAALRAPKLES
jgi:gas vesicle protein